MSFWKAVSYVLHPLWVPSLAMAMVLATHPSLSLLIPAAGQWRLVAFVFVFTAVVPGVTVVYMKRFGMVKSLELPHRKHRRLPLLVACLSFSAAFYMLRTAIPLPLIELLMLSGMLLMGLALLITLFYKISMHMMAWGAITGQVLALGPWQVQGFLIWFSVVVLCSGLAASSRMALKAHAGHELVAGFGLGFLVTGGLFRMLL